MAEPQVVMHIGGKCVGVTDGEHVFTHNMTHPWDPEKWTPIALPDVPVHLRRFLEAAFRRHERAETEPGLRTTWNQPRPVR